MCGRVWGADARGAAHLHRSHVLVARLAHRQAHSALLARLQPEKLPARTQGWRHRLEVVKANERRVAQLELCVPVVALDIRVHHDLPQHVSWYSSCILCCIVVVRAQGTRVPACALPVLTYPNRAG